jgi:hypothetical protein
MEIDALHIDDDVDDVDDVDDEGGGDRDTRGIRNCLDARGEVKVE